MDVSSTTAVARAASELSAARVGDAVATTVLKKALDINAQNAMALLEALPQPASNPPNLGNSVDVRA